MQGLPASVAANRSVLVSCVDLPNTVLTRSGAQGEFSVELYAPPGCTLLVKHDPTDLFLSAPDLLSSPRPLEVNVPPGTLVRNDSTSQGATTFQLTGRVETEFDPFQADFMVPFKASGVISSLQLSPGSQFRLSGTIKVLLPQGSTVPTGATHVAIGFQPITDAGGNWTGGGQKFGSVFKTPLGAPIERWETASPPFTTEQQIQLTPGGQGEYTGTFQFEQPLPSSLPQGYYRLFLEVIWSGAKWGTPAPSGRAFTAMYTYPPTRTFGPTVKVGTPASPRLPFMLFSDAIHNGSRGVEDPAQGWRSAQRITEPASYAALPRLDASGAPRTYRLEPVLPYLSYVDRGLVRAPFLNVLPPRGSITATVSGPGGTQTIGPAPIAQTRSSSPATVGGTLLDNGGGNLGDPLELTTNSPAFRYAFPANGTYSIRLQGSVQDQSGFTWTMDGTFKVVVAEPLDIDPAVLPGLPLKVGEKLPIGVQVNPTLPAQVEVEVRFAPNSDVARIVTRTYRGTTNRYGYYFGGEAFQFDGPGEYAVEFRASYQRGDQAWAGVLAWNGVVAEANPSIAVHGRRGIDSAPQPTRDRFTRVSTGLGLDEGQHLNFPYLSGDVLMETDNDAAQVRASFSDPTGALRLFFLSHSQPEFGVDGGTLAERFDIGEAPFVSKTTSGLDPSQDPRSVDLSAYYFASVTRPGERVRAGVTEDNTDTYYWRFLAQYAAQPGLGVEGDRPTDVKLQYVGGVVRTPQKNHYGRYASLWVQLPDEDGIGSRVVAPLSEPLMRIEGEDIRLFVMLTLAKPGTVLEVGDRFGLAGQVGPPVAAAVHIELKAPDGTTQKWDTNTNEIGSFFFGDLGRVLTAPGVYTVSVSATARGATGALFDKDSFPLPVVAKGAAPLKTNLPASGVVQGLSVHAAVESVAPVRSLITVPGWVLEDEQKASGPAVFELDAIELQDEYPLIDNQQPARPQPGLADEFVWVLMSGSGDQLQVRRVVLFGPELWNHD